MPALHRSSICPVSLFGRDPASRSLSISVAVRWLLLLGAIGAAARAAATPAGCAR